jgi:hypothetical protein
MVKITVKQWIRLCNVLNVSLDVEVDILIYKAEILQRLLVEERKKNAKKGE